jgi:hypothetical protein
MNSTAHVDETVHGRVLEVDLHGKLTRDDYERIVPETEAMIREHGKIRILITTHDFHGWDAGALWEDIKWTAKHFRDIERMAVVGEKTWHRLMTSFCKPFTGAQVRYFTPDQIDEARAWVESD